jgi:hypothetical protein
MWRRIALVLCVLSVSALWRIQSASACLRCPPDPTTPSASNHDASLTVEIPERQKVTLMAGGRSGGRRARVGTPKVLPPCCYVRRGSGKEMEGQIVDPALALYRQDWALHHAAWLLVPDTDPPPVVQVPAEILAVLAEAEARRLTWQVGADVPLEGATQIRTQRAVAFRVEEVQTVGTRLRVAL